MWFILTLLNLFGPIVAQNTVLPRNTFKGFGIVLPSSYLLYSRVGDSTVYLGLTNFGFYYNLDRRISFASEFNGRFEYVQADSSTNGIYPEEFSLGVKFGFPLSKSADFAIAVSAGIPLHLLGTGDTADLLGYPLKKKAYPALDIYCERKLGGIHYTWNAGYTGNSYGNYTSSLHYEGAFSYRFNGIKPFMGVSSRLFLNKISTGRPLDFRTFLGVSFISDFNAAFTIAFLARPFKTIYSSDIFIPGEEYKYGLIMNIESWVVNKRFKRRYTPRKERPAKFILLKRFVSLKVNAFDSISKTPLSSVKLKLIRDSKSVKTVIFDKEVRIDSLKRGNYRVTVKRERYIPHTFELNLTKDTAITVYLRKRQLKDTGWLILIIRKTNGDPISNATVSIVDLGIQAKTDSTGRVAFKIKSGRYLVNIKRAGYRPITRYFVVNKEERTEETVRLKRR